MEKNYERLEFKINTVAEIDADGIALDNNFYIQVEMTLQWVIWAPGREPLTNIFDFLSGDCPVEVHPEDESSIGNTIKVTWSLIPISLAQFLYDTFRYDYRSDVSRLKKYLDLKRGE